jgi:hypothetical protein
MDQFLMASLDWKDSLTLKLKKSLIHCNGVGLWFALVD